MLTGGKIDMYGFKSKLVAVLVGRSGLQYLTHTIMILVKREIGSQARVLDQCPQETQLRK